VVPEANLPPEVSLLDPEPEWVRKWIPTEEGSSNPESFGVGFPRHCLNMHKSYWE